jgi:hypothetical protein
MIIQATMIIILPTIVNASDGLFVFMPILPNIVTFCSFIFDEEGETVSDTFLLLEFMHSSSLKYCLN